MPSYVRPGIRKCAKNRALSMAVYGYRKMRAQLLAQGWDPVEIGRDQAMSIMRGLGVQGVRHGGAPVTTKNMEGLPLQALEQAISWAASHGGTDGLVHHGDHGTQYTGTVHTTRVREHGWIGYNVLDSPMRDE